MVISMSRSLKLLTGKAEHTKRVLPTENEASDLYLFVHVIRDNLDLIDRSLAVLFIRKFEVWEFALSYAKGYFDEKSFSLNCEANKFSVSLIRPFDFGKKRGTWVETIKDIGWQDFFGSSGNPIIPSTKLGSRTLMVITHLISYQGDPHIQAIRHVINNLKYTEFVVQPWSKVSKSNRSYRLLPIGLMDGILLVPGDHYYMRASFEDTGIVEVAPIGLIFYEHEYLKENF